MESLKSNYIMHGTGRTGGVIVLLNFMNKNSKTGARSFVNHNILR